MNFPDFIDIYSVQESVTNQCGITSVPQCVLHVLEVIPPGDVV